MLLLGLELGNGGSNQNQMEWVPMTLDNLDRWKPTRLERLSIKIEVMVGMYDG